MFKKRFIIILTLILFIFSVDSTFASIANNDLNETIIPDNCLNTDQSSDSVLNEDSNLNSNSKNAKNFNSNKDSILKSGSKEILKGSVKPSGNNFNDIQETVNNAKTNDIIELNGTYTSSGKSITVKKSLTFNAIEGTVLDGKKLSGIFYIPASVTVTFKNIKFINGVQSAIYGDSYNYMDNCKVKLIIDNCNFENNYNNYYGGAIYANTILVSNSNFTGNYVKDPEETESGIGISQGGAISSNYLNLTNCNFIKNNAQVEGGAISCEISLNIANSVFKQNSACSGGAIYAYDMDIEDSSFISNYLIRPSPKFTHILKGGAINSRNIRASNCIFKDNSASLNGGEGGAIYGNNIDAKNSVFENNIANYAGAISASRLIEEDTYSEGRLKIKNCSFISNNEGAIRASKAIIDNGNSQKIFKNKTLGNNLNVISLFKVSVKKFSTTYYSGKTMKIKILTSPSNKVAKYLLILVTAKSSKKKYSIPITTNSKGIAILKVSKLNVGTYKVYIHEAFCLPGSDPGDERYVKVPGTLKTISLKITKAKTITKAPAVKYKFKKSKYFKVIIKHKTTRKAFSGLKLKIKIFTGKKFKTYNVKTNKKGLARFNTKKLKRGKHKVIVSSRNKNVIVSKKSFILIR